MNTATRANSPHDFTIQRARFGRAPRVVIPSQIRKPARPERTSADAAFDRRFTRMAHRLRFREVGKTMAHFGADVHERLCAAYATYSVGGIQFAVVKPLSDGGLRIGVGLPEEDGLDVPSGLGGSARITGQFELRSHEPLRNREIGWLRAAYDAAAGA